MWLRTLGTCSRKNTIGLCKQRNNPSVELQAQPTLFQTATQGSNCRSNRQILRKSSWCISWRRDRKLRAFRICRAGKAVQNRSFSLSTLTSCTQPTECACSRQVTRTSPLWKPNKGAKTYRHKPFSNFCKNSLPFRSSKTVCLLFHHLVAAVARRLPAEPTTSFCLQLMAVLLGTCGIWSLMEVQNAL